MESTCKPSEASEKAQKQSRPPKAARTQKPPQQNAPSGSDPGHENRAEPDPKPGRGEPENHHGDAAKRRLRKHRRSKQAPGGTEPGTADHLTHTAPNQQQKKHNHKHRHADAAAPPLIDDSTAPDDDGGGGGGEKQKRRRKKKQKSAGRNTEDKPGKPSESGAVEKTSTPLKNTRAQGKVQRIHYFLSGEILNNSLLI